MASKFKVFQISVLILFFENLLLYISYMVCYFFIILGVFVDLSQVLLTPRLVCQLVVSFFKPCLPHEQPIFLLNWKIGRLKPFLCHPYKFDCTVYNLSLVSSFAFSFPNYIHLYFLFLVSTVCTCLPIKASYEVICGYIFCVC